MKYAEANAFKQKRLMRSAKSEIAALSIAFKRHPIEDLPVASSGFA